MSVLSITAVSHLAERHVREHRRVPLDALLLVLCALDIPAPRAHAGIVRAINRGAISVTDIDGRQVLVASDRSLPAASPPRNGATSVTSVVGYAAPAADTRTTNGTNAAVTVGAAHRQGLEPCLEHANCEILVQPGRRCRDCRKRDRAPGTQLVRPGGPGYKWDDATRAPVHLRAREAASRTFSGRSGGGGRV